MATLYYAVWAGASEVALGPVLREEPVTIAGTSTPTADVVDPTGGNRPRRVRVFADVACFVTWGANPVAAADGSDGRPVGAENPEYFDIPADQKLAVIARTLP